MADREAVMLAKLMVLVLTTGALFGAVQSSISLVGLLLLGYPGAAQFLLRVYI